VDEYKRRLLSQWEELPPIFITSSEKGIGKEELLSYIEEVNESVAAGKGVE
jgi:GTP-binding protein